MQAVCDPDRQAYPAGHVVHEVAPAREYWPLEHATGATVGLEQLDPAGHIVQVIFPVVSA